jgi:hypothetical protein
MHDESNFWGARRSITLCLVLALHVALIALLVTGSRTSTTFSSADPPIELMLLPPTEVPKEHPLRARLQHLSADPSIALVPPVLNSPSSSAPASNSGSDGTGGAVNWAAEAHRALRAFEIRRDQPPTSATSVSSVWDDWWPRQKHHAGEQYKTASGDWIVWINANCYQVASWHSGAPVLGETQPPTICPDESAKR